MDKTDLDFDARLNSLEAEWRAACEASRAAGADFLALSASSQAKYAEVQLARRRLDRAEQMKSRVMTQIERLEDLVSAAADDNRRPEDLQRSEDQQRSDDRQPQY
jgi:hypothetical protein